MYIAKLIITIAMIVLLAIYIVNSARNIEPTGLMLGVLIVGFLTLILLPKPAAEEITVLYLAVQVIYTLAGITYIVFAIRNIRKTIKRKMEDS